MVGNSLKISRPALSKCKFKEFSNITHYRQWLELSCDYSFVNVIEKTYQRALINLNCRVNLNLTISCFLLADDNEVFFLDIL